MAGFICGCRFTGMEEPNCIYREMTVNYTQIFALSAQKVGIPTRTMFKGKLYLEINFLTCKTYIPKPVKYC